MKKLIFKISLLLAAALLPCASICAAPMKARTIQPLFSADGSKLDESFQWTLDALAACDPSLDIIVLPEYSDVPGKATPKEFFEKAAVNAPLLIQACSETARRCSSLVFCGITDLIEGAPRNGLFIFDRKGELIGKYYKEHLTAGEWKKRGIDKSYTEEWNAPYMLEIEGLKFAFMICYDFYFYENYSNIARYSPDIIIGSSHQRSDPSDVLDLIDSFLAYHTGAYLVRSSVSMGEDSPVGGCSSVVSPRGKVLGSLFSKIGTLDVTFDPDEKYLKPAGYGNPPAKHCEYIEIGRRPWKYRPGGSAIVPPLWESVEPRFCAVDGYSPKLARKDIMASYGAAVASGAREIAFTISGREDLETFGKLLHKLSCHALMNVRVNTSDKALLAELNSMVFDFDAREYVYFSSACPEILGLLKETCPGAKLCMILGADATLDAAAQAGCWAVQVCAKRFDKAFADRAHELGLRCNVCLKGRSLKNKVDALFNSGADVILTKRFYKVIRY